ncbi:3-ketoacyl-ACP reductase [Rhodococcus sp. SC4]|nr:3-ketoacyl-ACP reductase [Rhodococcus sp. SC4]
MERLKDKVAFITGAARGQGRSHAVRLAEEGADIIAVDICAPVAGIEAYPMASEEDLAETVRLVEGTGRKIVAARADVRDFTALKSAVDAGVEQFGRLDIICANAGVFELSPALETPDPVWRNVIDINLTGAWNTCKAALPHLIEGGRGGSVIITSSTVGLKGSGNTIHYVASKHGVVGLMRALAVEFADHSIRVNTVHPTIVDTDMVQNDKMYRLFDPANEHPTRESTMPAFESANALPTPWVEPIDVSNAVVFLASDEARYITGATLPVDAGYTL